MNEDTSKEKYEAPKTLSHGKSPDSSRDSEEAADELNILELMKDAGETEKTRPEQKPPEAKGPVPSQSPPPPPPKPAPAPTPPVRWREYAGLILSLILCDVTIYHGGGFAGFGLMFLVLSLILLFCARERKTQPIPCLLALSLLAVGARLIYLGSWGCVIAGMFLVTALAVSQRGYKPFIIETAFAGIEGFFRSYQNLREYDTGLRSRWKPGRSGLHPKALFAPLFAVTVFGMIFIMANPVLKDFFGDFSRDIWSHISIIVPKFTQILFWIFILWFTAGLLYPRINDGAFCYREDIRTKDLRPAPEYHYLSSRNVFLSLIVLFAVYFVFEFYYLWWREIPRGFRYSEYAHQGARWLTLALALSTVLIGFVFQGGVLLHGRLPFLRRLAWIWSVENFILAICAFHRTQIYVHFNGLSRLRIVALFGIAVVEAGFVLVVLKVAWGKNLLWLIRRHLWALGLTVLLFLLTPVDYIVTSYNVKQILSGNPAPTVQIAVHKIGPDGCLQLLPLVQYPNEEIREGVRALLAETYLQLEWEIARAKEKGWSYTQLSKRKALRTLLEHKGKWEDMFDAQKRSASLARFKRYGRQWY